MADRRGQQTAAAMHRIRKRSKGRVDSTRRQLRGDRLLPRLRVRHDRDVRNAIWPCHPHAVTDRPFTANWQMTNPSIAKRFQRPPLPRVLDTRSAARLDVKLFVGEVSSAENCQPRSLIRLVHLTRSAWRGQRGDIVVLATLPADDLPRSVHQRKSVCRNNPRMPARCLHVAPRIHFHVAVMFAT